MENSLVVLDAAAIMVVPPQCQCPVNLLPIPPVQHTHSPSQLVEEFPVAQAVLVWTSTKEHFQLAELESWQ